MTYLTAPEVAELLRVKPDRVRRWILNGELIGANLGDACRPRYRISQADLQMFLDRRSIVQKPERKQRRTRQPLEVPERY